MMVLDIGGWAHPFNRANYVMDLAPYVTRGFHTRRFAKNNPIPERRNVRQGHLDRTATSAPRNLIVQGQRT